MVKKILFSILLLTSFHLYSQTKKVLLEEFTGAHCGNCPMGSYTVDSLLQQYPDLIAVSLHSYPLPDSMFFPEIDTIGTTYAGGAPMGATDRISWGVFPSAAETGTYWGGRIQTRLQVPAALTVSVNATWNASTRNITALVSTDILNTLPTADYRFNLYIVEDSVTGTGSGYDQSNLYNTLAGNPFYNMGDPIVGYIHRHVVRAILPYSWGENGVISSTPVMGQSFSTTYNYTLPAAYDENRIKLVAFVSVFTSGHTGDEVLNATENELTLGTGIADEAAENIRVWPNPSSGSFRMEIPAESDIEVYNMLGEVVWATKHKGGPAVADLAGLPDGVYLLKISENGISQNKKLVKRGL